MAVATLMGTVIGAGILALPYVIAKAGFLLGLLLMLGLGGVFVFIHLFVGEIVLRTKEQFQLTGYAEKYLGSWGKKLMTFTFIFGIYGALIAYTIGEGEALHAIFKIGSPLLWSILFFVAALGIALRGIKTAGKVELVLNAFLFVVVVIIGLLSYKNMQWEYLAPVHWSYFLFPYGAILFAYMGATAVPQMQEVLERDRRLMKKAILIGSSLPILVYVLFSVIIISLVGLENFEMLAPNQRIATVALSFYASPLLGILANLLAVLTMSTSFFTLSIALLEMYHYDYRFSRVTAALLTFVLPFLIALFGVATFIGVIGITGTLAGGVLQILVVLMYWKAKKLGNRTPEYTLGKHYWLGTFFILLFLLGILYQLTF